VQYLEMTTVPPSKGMWQLPWDFDQAWSTYSFSVGC